MTPLATYVCPHCRHTAQVHPATHTVTHLCPHTRRWTRYQPQPTQPDINEGDTAE